MDQGICGFPSSPSKEAFPQGCPTSHGGVSRSLASKPSQCKENRFLWNGLRHLGESWNGGTTLQFLSPFLWRAPLLEMRWECREFFPEQAGKGSLISSYESETGFLWIWPGPSCFLLSGDGYVGELLELQHGCERLFGSSRGQVCLASRHLSGNGPHLHVLSSFLEHGVTGGPAVHFLL